MARRIIVAAVSVVAVACVFALWAISWRDAGARQGAIEWGELTRSREWLEDVSAWSQSIDLSRERPAKADLGSFPLGNGHVFTMLGLSLPLNTTENTVGPTYQKRAGFLGHDLIGLRVDGRDVACPTQSVQRVRRSGLVRTAMCGDAYGLETLDFAPPELAAIVRIINLRNLSDRPFRADVVVHVQGLVRDSDGSPRLLRRGPFRILAGVVGDGARVRAAQQNVAPDGAPEGDSDAQFGAILTVPFGMIGPKQGRAKIHYLAISRDAQAEARTVQAVEAAGASLLDQTRAWWQNWHAGTTGVRCPDERMADLVDDAKEIMKTQQAALGGFAPMHLYTYCWARDSNGPIRYLLRCGKFEDVRKAIDYYYEACARRRGIPMNHALDIAMTGDTPKVNWRNVPVEPAEVPSFLVLQHHWYYRYSGDTEPLQAHWDYLKRNVEGQAVSPDGRLPFHGDETYRFPGYAIWLAGHTEPTDYVELDNLYSADSAFEYVAAAEAMSEMATALGKQDEAQHFWALAQRVREVTERLYWQAQPGIYAPASSRFSECMYRYPFANINLRPLWVGYSDPASPRAQHNALNALSYLWRKNGTVDTTPGFGYTTGMTPGMVLYNLAAIDHAAGETALGGVIEAFSKSAGVAEMLEPDNRPSAAVWGERRIRPWEGGINAEAVLYYLSGFEPDAPHMRARLCPRLPFGWQSMDIRNMRVADNRLAVAVNAEPTQRRYRVTNDGTAKVAIEFVVSLPECSIEAMSLHGRAWEPKQPVVARWGRTRQTCELVLAPHGEAEIVVEHGPPAAGEAGKMARRAFQYPPPDIGRAKTVVVTARPETASKWRQRDRNAFIIDSYVAFPPSYLRQALLTPDGTGRRVDTLVLDVKDWPGSFKRSWFWQSGPGAKIRDRFAQLGGRVIDEPLAAGQEEKRLVLYPGRPSDEPEADD